MAENIDPYYEWLGIPPAEQPANHYRLLGIKVFEDDPKLIHNAADQRIAYLRTFQIGKYSEESQKLLNKIAVARVCLSNPEKKAAYDEQLRKAMNVDPDAGKPQPPAKLAVLSAPPPLSAPLATRSRQIAVAVGAGVVLICLVLGALLLRWGAKKEKEVAQVQVAARSNAVESPSRDISKAKPAAALESPAIPTPTTPASPSPAEPSRDFPASYYGGTPSATTATPAATPSEKPADVAAQTPVGGEPAANDSRTAEHNGPDVMTPAAAAAVPANTAVGEKQPGDHSLFDGQWDCNDVVITLYSDFTAHKSAPRNPLGTWEYVDGEARIAWNDGKRTVLRRDGEGFRKLTWMAGANPDSPPDNSFPAVKKGDTATETAAPPEMAAKETAAPAAAAVSAPRSTATEQKFVRLFNGRNLSGWHLRDVSGPRCWSVRKGELICVARQKKMDLISDRLFRDFELQLDFKLGPGGDSGVFLRGRYQVQLFDTTKKMAPPKSACGAIQGQIAPLRQAYFGPGRWNTLAVTLVGRQVTVVMNGQVVIDAQQISGPTVDALDDLEDQPGPILLQCWLNEFAFRNIRIRPIQ